MSVSDWFGNAAASAFDDCGSVSFALKVDQSGYLASAPKFGYFGSWLGGGGGALDVASWVVAASRVSHIGTARGFLIEKQ